MRHQSIETHKKRLNTEPEGFAEALDGGRHGFPLHRLLVAEGTRKGKRWSGERGYTFGSNGELKSRLQEAGSRFYCKCRAWLITILRDPPHLRHTKTAEYRARGRPRSSRSVIPVANLILYLHQVSLHDFTTFYCKTQKRLNTEPHYVPEALDRLFR